MENPDTWGPAEHVIREVLQSEHEQNLHGGLFMAGLSLERRIADALRAAHLLRAEPGETITGGSESHAKRLAE
jgi:hypothetical protein